MGEDDSRVSRRHGTFTYSGGQWRLRNTGRLPIRSASRLLFPGEESVPWRAAIPAVHRDLLPPAPCAGGLCHRPPWAAPVPRHAEITRPPKQWPLDAVERLVLVVFAQRYLLHHPHPQPLS
ncbi:hypothetical protein NKH77_00415 [Streptomyces sp. M19]